MQNNIYNSTITYCFWCGLYAFQRADIDHYILVDLLDKVKHKKSDTWSGNLVVTFFIFVCEIHLTNKGDQ